MAGADKRAKLLSDLLASKGAAAGAAERAPEPERAAVVQIAKRRSNDDRVSEAPAAPSVLYSKGAATASTFRPSHWSFEREERAEPRPAPAKAEPPPAVPPAAIEPPVIAPPASTSRPLPINFVVAFGCVALCLSTALFVLSQQHRAEAPDTSPAPAAVATAPLPAAPPMPSLPASADSVVTAPAAAPAPVAPATLPEPALPSVAVAPPPPMPVVSAPPPPSEAPPAAVAEPPPAPAQSIPTVASTPAANPASAADTQQAEALLARGDDLLATGDVAAARLFYQRAAELGSAPAATAVGQTYDPGVLELLRVRGARGDVQTAAEWYRKAIAAGDRQAEIRLKRLLARTSG